MAAGQVWSVSTNGPRVAQIKWTGHKCPHYQYQLHTHLLLQQVRRLAHVLAQRLRRRRRALTTEFPGKLDCLVEDACVRARQANVHAALAAWGGPRPHYGTTPLPPTRLELRHLLRRGLGLVHRRAQQRLQVADHLLLRLERGAQRGGAAVHPLQVAVVARLRTQGAGEQAGAHVHTAAGASAWCVCDGGYR